MASVSVWPTSLNVRSARPALITSLADLNAGSSGAAVPSALPSSFRGFPSGEPGKAVAGAGKAGMGFAATEVPNSLLWLLGAVRQYYSAANSELAWRRLRPSCRDKWLIGEESDPCDITVWLDPSP